MYNPKYEELWDSEKNEWIKCMAFDNEYMRWAGKNKYTHAIHLIYWGWGVINPLIEQGIIIRHKDESLEWTLKNRDSLVQLFKDWPMDMDYDPDMPESLKHIPGGFWGPIETAFNIKRGSLRYLVSTNGRYYDKPNPEYEKIKKYYMTNSKNLKKTK